MKFTQNVKRGLAMLLTLAMLVSSGNFGMILNAFAETGDHNDHLHATLGQVIINNLDSLTVQQEYLLKSGYLVADEQYHYAPPADAADLVVVDSAAKTITAKSYTDSEGNLWVPIEFSLVGDADAVLESGVLNLAGEDYLGQYTTVAENFSVHITYAFELNLTADEKAAVEAMINAGAALQADMDTLEYLNAVSVLSGVDQATKDKIIALVGGIDPNAELVLKAMVMDLSQLGGQTAVDLAASLATEGIYLPLLETDADGNIIVDEQGVYLSLGEEGSPAYKAALSLKQQQDAQNALDLMKVLDDYMDLCDLALLAKQSEKLEAALNGNYAELEAIATGLKDIKPVIDEYLTETVPSIYTTVYGMVNDALAAYDFDKTVNSPEELTALVEELKATYADGLKQINEKLAGTSYGQVSTPEDITALKAQLEKDFADNVEQINTLLVEYGYTGTLVSDSASLQGPIDWANNMYSSALAEINATLTEYGYTGRPVTNSTTISRPIVWLEDEIYYALEELNDKLVEYGYPGKAVETSTDMVDVINWLNGEYAAGLEEINKLLKDNGYTGEDVTNSDGMDAVVQWLSSEYAAGLAEINKLLKDNGYTGATITGSENIDSAINWLGGEYADGLAEINKLLTDNGYTGEKITGSANIDSAINWLSGEYADGLAEINKLLTDNGYTGEKITGSENIDSAIAWLNDQYADGLEQLNKLLTDNGYTGAKITNAAEVDSAIAWLNGEYTDALAEMNELLQQYEYTGKTITNSTDMYFAITWLNGEYAKAIKTINENLTQLRDAGIECEDVKSSADIPAIIQQLEDTRTDLLAQADAAAKEAAALAPSFNIPNSITSEEDVDALIKQLKPASAFVPGVADALEQAQQLRDALTAIAEAKEGLEQAEDALAAMEEAAPKLEEAQIALLEVEDAMAQLAEAQDALEQAEDAMAQMAEAKDTLKQAEDAVAQMAEAKDTLKQAEDAMAQMAEAKDTLKQAEDAMDMLAEGKDTLKQAEDAMDMLTEAKATLEQGEEALDLMAEAQKELVKVEEALDMIPEVKEKMELAEYAIEALGLMDKADEAIIKLEEADELFGQFVDGVAELEAQSDNLKLLIIIMDGFTSTVKPVVDAFAEDNFQVTKLLGSDLPDATYELIENNIAGATAYTGEIPDKLTVAKTTLIVNVARFDIRMKYQASIVDPTKTDSAETIALPVYEETVALAGGATATEVLDAIQASGALDAAIAQWGIDVDKFDITVPELAEDFLLTSNLDYTVTFTPKTYKLTLDYGAENVSELDVPYGYRYTTPVHSDSQKEYIYTAITDQITELEQGDVWTVKEDTTITRSQGAVSERKDLLELIAKTVETDADIKNILTSSVLKPSGSFNIRLPGKDQVSIVYDSGRDVTVVIAPNYDSRVGGLMWVADSVTIDGVTYPMTNGVYETQESFMQADVHYQLALTSDALGFENTQVLGAMNTPYNLVAEYNAQKITLDDLAELMPLLKKLNDEDLVVTDPTSMTLREALGMIEHLQASYNLSDETVAAGKALYKLIPVNGHVALYDTMELYTHGGMYHYYRNEETYKTQICQLDDILQVLVNDEAFMELVNTAAHGLFEEVKDTLDAAADVMANHGVNHEKIDVTDENLRTLLGLLETAEPTLYNRVPASFDWKEDVHVTGLGYTNVTVNVTFGGVTYTEDHVEATGTILTADRLLAWAEAMKVANNIGPEYEEYFTVRHDFADTPMTGAAVTFNYTWDVNQYEIKVDGTDVVVGTINYNYMHLDLPAHTEEGMRYDYKIGELGVANGAYELGIEQFKGLVNGTIKVTRTEVNEAEERLQLQEDLLVDFVNHMEGAAVLTKDDNGKYTIVFRMDYANITDSFTKFGVGLFMGGYDHIGFDHHVFYGEGQYYFQAFIDALLHSGAGTHTVLEEINADGTLQHLQLSDATVLTDYSYETLGAEVMHTTAYFEKDGEMLEADFYITLDGEQAAMKTLRDRIALVDKYLQLTFEDGQAIAHLTLPEPVYAAYVAALVANGKIDMRHINDLDTQVAIAFLVDMINPVLDKNSADWSAVENTLGMITDRVDISKYEGIYQTITSSYDSTKVVYDGKSVYVPLENIQVKQILDLVQGKLNEYIGDKEATANIDLSKIVAEYNTGVDINLSGHLENMDIQYAALFVSAKADGITNKAGVATMDELPAIAENANLIVLLDEVNTDLNFNSAALVDLNGQTVNGNITGNGRLFIIDSAYQSTTAAMGTVNGTVTGATIFSGKYLSDVSGLLPGGYVQEENGIVHNKLFTMEDDGANNLTLTLNADIDDLLDMIDVKGIMGIAVDAAMEVALNNYIYSSLYLDGKQVYDIQVNDIMGIIGGDDKKQDLIDTLKSWVSIEDLKYIAQDIVNALTDYDALYEALAEGGDGIIYQVDTLVTGYGITTEKIDNNGQPYYTVSIGGDATSTKSGSLTVKVTGDLALDMLLLTKAVKDTVSVNVSVDDIGLSFADKTLNVAGDFGGQLIIDLRNNPDYVVMMAVVLAHGNPEIRDELVAAIDAYYATGVMDEMEDVFNTLTAKQIIAGWSKADRHTAFADMVNGLGLSEDASAAINASIDDNMLGFELVVEIGAILLRKIGVAGNNVTLGSFLKQDSENGDNFYGVLKSKDFLGEKTVQSYAANYDVSIENVGVMVYLFHTHKWDEGVEIKAPDCANEGEVLYTCTTCGHTKTETVPATDHTYGDLITKVEATCENTGMEAHYFCSVCNKYFNENKEEVTYESLVIPEAHDFGELVEEVPATCTEPGMKAYYKCPFCGKYFDEEKNEVAYEDLIIPAGHAYGELIEEVPATCTEPGMKAHYYDAACGKYFDEEKNEVAYEDLIIPAGHAYGELIEEVPATCTEPGMKAHYYDAECGKYFDENKQEVSYESLIITASGHDYGELVAEKPATCGEPGLKEHYYDAECGKYFDVNKNEVAYEDLIIPAPEHNYGELVQEVPATCTEPGMKAHYYDAECGKYFDENKNEVAYEDLIIPAGHNYGELVQKVPATCTEPGMKAHYYDAECGKYFDENKQEVSYESLIIPVGHSFDDLIEEEPATCTEPGMKAHYYCSGCDKYFDENKNEVAYADLIIPVKDHNYGDWVEEVPAEVGKTGLKGHYYDAECGKYFDENKNEVAYADLIIPALSAGVEAPVLGEALVDVGHIHGAVIRVEENVKYLIVDADAREGLTFAELSAMFPTVTNRVDCEKVTTIQSNGAAVETTFTTLMVTGYKVTYTATNDAGADSVTYILVILGDINCDGKNTSSDAAEIKQYKLTNEPFETRAQELAADINCDGMISSSDANTIKLKVLNSVNSEYAYTTKVKTLEV